MWQAEARQLKELTPRGACQLLVIHGHIFTQYCLVWKNVQPKLEEILAEVKALRDGDTRAQNLVGSKTV